MSFEEIGYENDRVERLIGRLLDGEIADDDRRELDAILAEDAGARALLADYRRNDRLAAAALRRDLVGATTAVSVRTSRRGLWLATVGGVLSAAAVIVLSFAPDLWRSTTTVDRPIALRQPRPIQASPDSSFVDYRNVDDRPALRERDVVRDVIGIQGDNPNVIYLLERNRRATRITPISGDF